LARAKPIAFAPSYERYVPTFSAESHLPLLHATLTTNNYTDDLRDDIGIADSVSLQHMFAFFYKQCAAAYTHATALAVRSSRACRRGSD